MELTDKKSEFEVFFKSDLIFRDVDWKDRTELFDKISTILEEKGYVYSTFHNAIKEREQKYPTGIQTQSIGVAIPHTDQENIKQAFISVVRPTKPIEFSLMGGISNEPIKAKLIFILGVKRDGLQVKVLQKLMEIFSNENIINSMLQAESDQELYKIIKDAFQSQNNDWRKLIIVSNLSNIILYKNYLKRKGDF